MTARSSIVGFFNDQPIDNRVPTWDGTGGAVGLELYARLAEAYTAGLEENKVLLAAPRLWSNLRGEAHAAVEKLPAADLKQDDGLETLLNALKARWPEGPLRRLPRLYLALFKEIQYRPGDSVGPVFADLERSRKDVEIGDPTVRVSEGIMGFLLLDVLQLAESEQAHILGLTGFQMSYDQVKAVVAELYPRGSHKSRHQPPARYATPPWKRQHNFWPVHSAETADAADAYYDPAEEYDQQSNSAFSAEADPDAEQAENWVTESAEEAYYAEEQLAALLSTVAEDTAGDIDDGKKENLAAAYAYVAEAHMSMRDAKQHMNGIAKARGFFPKGTAASSSASSSDGKNGKGATPKPAVDASRKANTRCLACGRLGHWRGDVECPKKGQGKSKGKGKKGNQKGKGLLSLIMTAVLMVLGGAEPLPPLNPRDSEKHVALAGSTIDFDYATSLWTDKQPPLGVIDTGCTNACAGSRWLRALAAETYRYGLMPRKEPCAEHFYGLGGTLKESKVRWTFPVGIFGNHAIISFCEVDGNMPGLIAKSDLKGFGFVWHSATNTADFLEFGISGQELLESTSGCTMLSLTDYDPKTVGTDDMFKQFHVTEHHLDQVKDTKYHIEKAGALLSERLKNARDETVERAVGE